MSISIEDIKKVASLAKLELNEVEIEKYQNQLGSILEYIDVLKKVKVSDLEILGINDENFNKTREDEIIDCPEDERDIALKQMSDKENSYIKVNRIL